jgi:hypothetical protein
LPVARSDWLRARECLALRSRSSLCGVGVTRPTGMVVRAGGAAR